MAEIILTITTDTHRARLLMAILDIWGADDGKGLLDLYDVEQALGSVYSAVWDIAWTVWGDEGLIDVDQFLDFSSGMDEPSRNGLWALRKLCYAGEPDKPPERR